MPSGTCCLRRNTGVLYHHTFTLSSLFLVNFSTFYTSAFYNFFAHLFSIPLGNQTRSTSFPVLPFGIGHSPAVSPRELECDPKAFCGRPPSNPPQKKSVAYKGFALLHLHLYNYTSFNGLILTPIPIVGAIVTLLRN